MNRHDAHLALIHKETAMRRRTILFLLTLAPLIACGDSTGPGIPRVEGTWHLQAVNGAPLPVVLVQFGASKLEILSDVITAVESGSFTQMSEFRVTDDGGVPNTYSTPDAGSFTLNGSAVTLVSNADGDSATGTIDGNTMTFAEAGFTLVYRRN